MAVVSPIPSYTSNSFKLPKGVCIEFKSMFARFWWSQMGNERRDYWVSWTDCAPQSSEAEIGLRILMHSIWVFWLNRAGDSSATPIPCFIRCFRPNTQCPTSSCAGITNKNIVKPMHLCLVGWVLTFITAEHDGLCNCSS